PHSEDVPVPVFESFPDVTDDERATELLQCDGLHNHDDRDFEGTTSQPKQFNRGELNDLVRDLNLPKKSAELLASRLSEKNLLQSGTTISFYRTRDSEFVSFFSEKDGLVYCNDIVGLLDKLGISNYNPQEWRLFMDSSKYSLKVVLLHNGNKYGSIPVAHSTKLKETYETVKL
ncbi:Uncharacterized protein FKW44_008934, partial [Caligus rogercresseyi]